MSGSFRFGPAARAGGVGLVVGLALATVLGSGRGMPRAQAQPPGAAQAAPGGPAQAGGTIAFTAANPGHTGQLLYLIDTRGQSFAVYSVNPNESRGAVKLEAVRKYRWDLEMAEYNNQAPEVATIEAMVREATPGRR